MKDTYVAIFRAAIVSADSTWRAFVFAMSRQSRYRKETSNKSEDREQLQIHDFKIVRTTFTSTSNWSSYRQCKGEFCHYFLGFLGDERHKNPFRFRLGDARCCLLVHKLHTSSFIKLFLISNSQDLRGSSVATSSEHFMCKRWAYNMGIL